MTNVYPFADNDTLREEAVEWLIRLDGDEPLEPAVMAELQAWLNRSPQHRENLEQLASTWGRLNVLTELSVPLDKPVKAAGDTVRGEAGQTRMKPAWSYALAGVAGIVVAGVALLFATGLWPNAQDETNGRYATAIGQQRTVELADGSTVQLNTGTVVNVTYNEDYRDIRLMQGEAYFDVAKNKRKPFRVYAGTSRVQAVGTAFTVYVKDEDVAVTVTDGRVSLAGILEEQSDTTQTPSQGKRRVQPKEEELGMLVAGQGATLKRRPRSSEDAPPKVELENIRIYNRKMLDRQLSWREGLLVFGGEPLEQVVQEISRYTTLNIEIPQSEVRNIKVGGQFEVGDTEMMLKTFEDVFSLKVVREENNRVLILAGNG